jgi:hypothetical protein
MTFASAAARSNGAGSNLSRTTNGAATNLTTHSACVDFFAQAPAMRGKEAQALILFQRAYAENREYALRTLLWLRDIRGGAGERQTFRYLLSWLSQINANDAALVVTKTPEVGRWDDLFAVGDAARDFAFAFIDQGLTNGDRLAAKWMPRKGADAEALRKALGLTPKGYRKLIVGLSDTVEQKMCAREWDSINFSHVPSVAAKRYQKAFNKRAVEAYAAYKAALVKNDGTAKVNASAIFPHDVISGYRRGDTVVAEAQWRSLPDYLGSDAGILPLIDLSGSMCCPLGGRESKSSVTCRDTAMALGLYTAERQTGAFKNLVFTFSSSTRVVQLADTMSLKAKLAKINDNFMGSTNIDAAFRKILEIAVANNVAPQDMPRKLLILSDMEFDKACDNATALDMVRKAYAKAGYAMPQIVFWNLNARLGNNPVTIRDDGTALVGGYSPALLKALLNGDNFTPEDIMLNAIMNDRYKVG